jgi:hypothetical protein
VALRSFLRHMVFTSNAQPCPRAILFGVFDQPCHGDADRSVQRALVRAFVDFGRGQRIGCVQAGYQTISLQHLALARMTAALTLSCLACCPWACAVGR